VGQEGALIKAREAGYKMGTGAYFNKIRCLSLIVFAVLTAAVLAAPAYPASLAKKSGVSLRATGFEWLGYSPEEKKAFAALINISFGEKKGTYKPDEVIKKLDDFYYGAFERAKADPLNVDVDDSLEIPCVEVINGRT
jgi:hypothetical protein